MDSSLWQNSALTLSVLIPLVGAIVVAATPAAREEVAKRLTVVFTFATFVVTLGILVGYDYGTGDLQYEVNARWITAFNSRYHLGIDGISLPLVVLTGLLCFLCAIYSLKVIPNPGKPRALLSLMLLLEVGMMGAFISLDLLLFFIFFEIVLVPMFFMIAIWGGANRGYASIKFFLYTLFGSAFMLLGFLGIYFNSGGDGLANTFDMVQLAQRGAAGHFAEGFQLIAFAGLFLGFAIKVPMWPLHTWLPDAHTEAPTIGSVLLAGVMLKMGTYGFVRIALPILPEGARKFAPVLGILATVAIVYGSLCCLAQKEIKRMIAFSSVGHMGFVMLGIATLTPTGINAALFGNIAHGVITGMLFFIVGSVKERYHTGEISEIGGGMLAKMPYMGSLFTFVAIASLGLPGLAGFWGEIFALLAAFRPAEGLSVPLFRTLMVFGAIGTVLTAGYFLWLLQRVNLGVVPERWRTEKFSDVMGIELGAWAPLLVLIVAFGVFPRFVFGITEPAMGAFTKVFGG
jgi:NADH-quinone oxidoreductase subunit M